MTNEEMIEHMEQVHGIANDIIGASKDVGIYHPGVIVAACAMAAGSIGTICSMSKEKFLAHMHGMVAQAWDRQLEAQAEAAKDHGPLQ